jgi:polysaccharide biosynthesis protein PslH
MTIGGTPGDNSAAAPDQPLRLLYLTPFPPSLDGAHGGSRVIAQLLDRLAERHRVGLMCLRHPSDAPVDRRLRSRLELVEEVERADLDRSHRIRALRGVRDRVLLLGGTPLWATDVNVPAFHRRLEAVLADWKPDVVQIQYTAMGVHLPEIEVAARPVILWEPDPATNAAIDLGRVASGDRLLRRLDVRAWRRFERDVLRRVDVAVVFTGRDVQALSSQAPATPVVRIPFGTDFAGRSFVDRAAAADVLFVGNFVHPPNIDAAERLVHAIFPRVLEAHPSASLHIVGDNPPPELLEASGGAVTVTGRVPDPVPYIERATLVAAPIRFGGGMRVKVLEALAAGKPLVASRLAVEGLELSDGDEFVAAESDEEFADRIGGLLADESLRRRLGARARAWAQENLTWERSVAAYEDLYARLLRERASPPPARPAHSEAGLA